MAYLRLSLLGIAVIVVINIITNWFESNLAEPPKFLDWNNPSEVMRIMGSVVGFTMFIVGLFMRFRKNPDS